VPKRDAGYMALQREKILVASLREFAVHGFRGASMRDVAKRLGVSVGTIYIHFKNKDELFQGLVDRHQSQFPGMHTATLTELRGFIRQGWSRKVDADVQRMNALNTHMIVEAMTNRRVRKRLDALAESSRSLFEGAVARDPRFAHLSPAKRRILARRLLYWWTGVSYYRPEKAGTSARRLLPDLEAGIDLLIADALRG